MKERHLNTTMLIFALIGGIIGFIVGEIIVKSLQYLIPNVVLVGLYFAQFAVFIVIACFIAETINPKIAGSKWHTDFKTKSFFIFVTVAAVGFFALGCLLQFIYSLGTEKQVQIVQPDDYCFTVDCSGSMSGDSSEKTKEAINNMINNLSSDKRASCVCFQDVSKKVIDLTYMTDGGKEEFIGTVSPYITHCGGGTDIQTALSEANRSYTGEYNSNRKKSVILVSDGIDSIELDEAIAEFSKNDISVYVIGVNMGMKSVKVFEKLADETNGRYYDAQSTAQLDFIFQNIGSNVAKSNRLLIDHRYGAERTNMYYKILRIVMITCLGIALGAIIGLLFDNKFLVRNFMIGGIITGCLAGIVIELGCIYYWNIGATRFFSDLLLSMIISLFSAIISYEIESGSIMNYNSISVDNNNLGNGTNSVERF